MVTFTFLGGYKNKCFIIPIFHFFLFTNFHSALSLSQLLNKTKLLELLSDVGTHPVCTAVICSTLTEEKSGFSGEWCTYSTE